MNKSPTTNTADFSWFWTRLDRYLAEHELKQTKQRKQIIESLILCREHIDAESLHNRVRIEDPNIGLATIYRTLNMLKSAGLISEHAFADGKAVYEIDVPDMHHDHLVCIECHQVIEFENAEIEKLQEKIAGHHGFKLTSHRLDLFGLCSPCSKKEH